MGQPRFHVSKVLGFAPEVATRRDVKLKISSSITLKFRTY